MGLPGSDDEILLLHNPRCSKSRATKELLEENGVEFAVRAYLDEHPSLAEVYRTASEAKAPVMFHTGTSVFPGARIKWPTRPNARTIAPDTSQIAVSLRYTIRRDTGRPSRMSIVHWPILPVPTTPTVFPRMSKPVNPSSTK